MPLSEAITMGRAAMPAELATPDARCVMPGDSPSSGFPSATPAAAVAPAARKSRRETDMGAPLGFDVGHKDVARLRRARARRVAPLTNQFYAPRSCRQAET